MQLCRMKRQKACIIFKVFIAGVVREDKKFVRSILFNTRQPDDWLFTFLNIH